MVVITQLSAAIKCGHPDLTQTVGQSFGSFEHRSSSLEIGEGSGTHDAEAEFLEESPSPNVDVGRILVLSSDGCSNGGTRADSPFVDFSKSLPVVEFSDMLR